MTKRVLSVGQCVPDHAAISRMLKSAFDVTITQADTGPAALELMRMQPFDLVLINRKLDIDYSDGNEILRAIKADAGLAATPVMIVTNYAEHQDNAVALGAERGFGKSDLGTSDVVAKLEPWLGKDAQG
ncbi:MAG: response regulator [Planctomycetaceae bacterium]|nr:response regulator [Planctomycetaceae bacterium]